MTSINGFSPAYGHYRAQAQYTQTPKFGGFVLQPDGSVYEMDETPKRSLFSFRNLIKLGAVGLAGFLGIKYGLPRLKGTTAYSALGLDRVGNFLSGLHSSLNLEQVGKWASGLLSRVKFW